MGSRPTAPARLRAWLAGIAIAVALMAVEATIAPCLAAQVELRPTAGILHFGPSWFTYRGVEASLWSWPWHGLMAGGFLAPTHDWTAFQLGSPSWAEISLSYKFGERSALTFGPVVSLMHLGTSFHVGFGLESTYSVGHLDVRLSGGQLRAISFGSGRYEQYVAQQGSGSWAELALSWRF